MSIREEQSDIESVLYVYVFVFDESITVRYIHYIFILIV